MYLIIKYLRISGQRFYFWFFPMLFVNSLATLPLQRFALFCFLLELKNGTNHRNLNRSQRLFHLLTTIFFSIPTYVARHSYATVLKRAGVSTSIICESLGHSSEKVTQYYLDSFENSQIDEAMKNLLWFDFRADIISEKSILYTPL